MKKIFPMALVLAVLMTGTRGTLAADFANLKPNILPAPINFHQGGPMDSVLVIKGKIDMGQTNYYSVIPVIGENFMLDGKPIAPLLQEMGFQKADVVPQFKSSAASGWAIYIYLQTGNSPDRWQKFKALNNATIVSMGAVQVKYQQGGNTTTLPAAPGQGTQITGTIGPVQSK